MFPLFSILRREKNFATQPHQFVLLHLKRLHLMEWVRSDRAWVPDPDSDRNATEWPGRHSQSSGPLTALLQPGSPLPRW